MTRTASPNGGPDAGVGLGTATGSALAFTTAYDRDGTTIITATATREHSARTTPGERSKAGVRRDAWLAGQLAATTLQSLLRA
jgi:hypothetical protein